MYSDLYSGPEFFLHYKYSQILTVSYVTFMYGYGLPLLFPVACVSIGILYFTEKTMLYYVYKTPPNFNIASNKRFLKILRFAPILFCMVGYWMCSNWYLIHNTNLVDREPLRNFWFTIKGWHAPGWPLLVISIIIGFLIIFDDAAKKTLLGKISPHLAMDLHSLEELDTANHKNYWALITD